MNFTSANAFIDLPCDENEQMADSFPLNIISGGSHLFGYLLKPDSRYKRPAPAVIMFHGFPGYTTNNDLEYALMRMGAVVIHVNHRGAWGSGGNYLFSNLTEDAAAIAKWVHNPAVAEKYEIDAERIFLAGHSMGGMTVLNASKDLPFIRGVIAMAPYDLHAAFTNNLTKELFEMIEGEGQCLNMTSVSAVYENAEENHQKLSVAATESHLKNFNVLLVAAQKDTVAPPALMVDPLYNALVQQNAKVQKVALNANHCFGGQRTELAQILGKWLEENIKN